MSYNYPLSGTLESITYVMINMYPFEPQWFIGMHLIHKDLHHENLAAGVNRDEACVPEQ